ncbi:MAG: FlaD/FlaE family flagellar protein [Halobacteriota archaeon]
MEVNPKQYDATELRSLAEAAEPEVRADDSDASSLTAEQSLRSRQFRELLSLRAANATTGLDRPYLRSVPTSDIGKRLLYDWVEFLTLVGGREEARSALAYYQRLGWITPAVQHKLSGMVQSMRNPIHARRFEVGDHRLSLLYIATLASLA